MRIIIEMMIMSETILDFVEVESFKACMQELEECLSEDMNEDLYDKLNTVFIKLNRMVD
jgi:hypothetical protein